LFLLETLKGEAVRKNTEEKREKGRRKKISI